MFILLISHGRAYTNRVQVDHQQAAECFGKLDKLEISKYGLLIESIKILLGIVLDASNDMILSQKTHIVKSYLFFSEPLPDSLIVNVVSSLGFSKFNASRKRVPKSIQILLCDWLSSIWLFVKNRSIFVKLYGLLLSLFEFDFLRPRLFQLIKLTTTKAVVTTARIQQILGLKKKSPNDRYISSLLALYQDVCPGMIIGDFKSCSSLSVPVDSRYIEKLKTLHNFTAHKSSGLAVQEITHITGAKETLKKRRLETLTGEPSTRSSLLSLEGYLKSASKLRGPGSLHDIFMKKSDMNVMLFIMRASQDDIQELENWLYLSLEGFHQIDQRARTILLDTVVSYITKTGHFPSSIFKFIVKEFLDTSDATDYIKWNLVSQINQSSYITSAVIIYLKQNKSSLEWDIRFLDSILKSISNTINADNSNELSDCVKSLVSSFSTRIQRFNFNKQYIHTITDFISKLSLLPVSLSLECLVLPPNIFYALFLQNDSLIMSKICHHINYCREAIKNTPASPNVDTLINLHNSYVLDMINILWRDKAFGTNKTSLHSNLIFGITPELLSDLDLKIPLDTLSLNVRSIFGIIHSPAFASFSSSVVRELKESKYDCVDRLEGPITPKTIDEMTRSSDQWLDSTYEDIKLKILDRLSDVGLTGIRGFLFSHLKSLGSRQSKEAA